jgi:hypothetical protein
MQVQSWRDLYLPLPAVQDNRFCFLFLRWRFQTQPRKQPESLLEGRLRFELAFAVVVAMKSFTDWTVHRLHEYTPDARPYALFCPFDLGPVPAFRGRRRGPFLFHARKHFINPFHMVLPPGGYFDAVLLSFANLPEEHFVDPWPGSRRKPMDLVWDMLFREPAHL